MFPLGLLYHHFYSGKVQVVFSMCAFGGPSSKRETKTLAQNLYGSESILLKIK